MADKETTVSMLEIGSEFECGGVSYKLISVNQARAYVQILKMRHNVVKNEAGEVVEFDSPGKKVNISIGSVVENARSPAELEWDEPAPGEPAARPSRAKSTKVRVDKSVPAPTLKRPLRPDTKIGLMAKRLLTKGPATVAALEKEFDVTRNGVLSYLFLFYRDYGIGYVVGEKEMVSLVLPPKVKDPFKPIKPTAPAPKKEDLDDYL